MNKQGKCYKCGGFIAVSEAEDALICPFCGKAIVVEKAIRSYTAETPPEPQKPQKPPVNDAFFVVVTGVLISCSGFTETDIRIPDGVEAIGDAAFQGMNNIRTVHLPAGVKTIGSSAFSGCRHLESISIPEGVETVDRDAFNGCIHLKSVRFPDSITRMEAGALTGCTALESVNIPARIESLPWRIFEGCTSLRSVTIPKPVTTIEDSAFAECTALEEVKFACQEAGDVPATGVRRIGMNAFQNCRKLSRLELPGTLEYIGNQAFRGCESLRRLTIPANVKAIYPLAFADCTHLESVTLAGDTELYKGSNPYKYGDNAATFYNCPRLHEVSFTNLQKHFWAFPAYMKALEPMHMKHGKCRHCGGSFEGWSVKICSVCNTPKDY